MKGYSSDIPDNCACARLEEVNASYKDLAQVCGRIRNKKIDRAISFLEKAAKGEIPVLYKRHNKRLGHRRELGGRKGRYPKKAAKIVLKVLKSAMANGKTQGLGDEYTIIAASANKKYTYPRVAPKGRWARSNLETSRVEIVLKGSEIPKGVTVTPPKKKEEKKKEEKKEEKKPEAKKEEKREEPKLLKREAKEHHEHKHDAERAHEQEKKRKQIPHQHGEHDTR